MSEPRCIEISATSSVGGKVQLVKFDLSADYVFALTSKYEIPEDWTEEQVETFRNHTLLKLREEIEPHADNELQALFDTKEELNS